MNDERISTRQMRVDHMLNRYVDLCVEEFAGSTMLRPALESIGLELSPESIVAMCARLERKHGLTTTAVDLLEHMACSYFNKLYQKEMDSD